MLEGVKTQDDCGDKMALLLNHNGYDKRESALKTM